jgi:hypothetical protein
LKECFVGYENGPATKNEKKWKCLQRDGDSSW